MKDAIASHDEETIIALCTPQGKGALALLRMCGTQALEICAKFSKLSGVSSLIQLPTHTIHFGWVIDNEDQPIDQVMFLLMRGPKTFTGQDTVEITCHNNPFIIEAIIRQAILHGARLAHEGEFSKRAVLNNKIDLIQAEAINELINANTSAALKQSLAQVQGSFSQEIYGLEKNLIKALAFSEASFEFIDEAQEFGPEILEILEKICSTIQIIKKNFDQQKQIREGIRIAIIGSVNAGKSSLFNALLNKKRAIVTNIAGTTRDVIEEGLYKKNSYWTLIDTAGLRQTDDVIEKEGIERSHHEAQKADIILLTIDSSRILSEEEHAIYKILLDLYSTKTIIIYNKIDVAYNFFSDGKFGEGLRISTYQKNSIEKLEIALVKKIDELCSNSQAPFLLNQRHYNLILGLENKIQYIKQMLSTNIQYELLSLHLQDALAHLSELTGKTISEQGMDAVFREFCVGK